MNALTVLPVVGLGEVRPGDDLGAAILAAVDLQDGDVVVVAQKVVSKAEGALVAAPAADGGLDPRRELARSVAAEIVADAPWALIVRTQHGLVCANAGIDASNVPDGMLSLLPDDPDRSAKQLRADLEAAAGVTVAVVISDTFGRPWRVGQVDVAIGVAGLGPIRDERGAMDREGRVLTVTEAAVADELAAAADLVRRKADGVPVVVVRGFAYEPDAGGSARQLVRDAETDLFARGRGMLGAVLGGPWPQGAVGALNDRDIEAVLRVAPDAIIDTATPPTTITIADQFTAGLAAAVLADLGAAVRWRRDGDAVVIESGRGSAGR